MNTDQELADLIELYYADASRSLRASTSLVALVMHAYTIGLRDGIQEARDTFERAFQCDRDTDRRTSTTVERDL